MAYEDVVIMTLLHALEADTRQRRLDGGDPQLLADDPSHGDDPRHPSRPEGSPGEGLARFTWTLSRFRGIRA